MELFKLLGTIAIEGIEKANKALEGISSTAKSVGDKLKSAGDTISNVGTKLMPVTAALGGIAVASGKMSMDFEDAMAKVSTIADTSQVPIEQLESAIVELSNKTGIASSEIAENVYNAISAGQSTGDAVSFVEKATMLAKAGFAESGAALDILTTIMNSYGLEASEVDKVSNNLITTQNLGKTTVAELSSAMGKAIPTAKSVGVNLDQLCGSYAIMTSNGIATAETTTYLNSMLNELGKQGTSAEKAFRKGTEGIKAGGLSMKEAMESGWSLSDVLAVLDKEAKESGTSINNLFGSAEAGKAASVLFDNTEGLNSAVEQMGKSTGATETAFSKLETNSFKIQKAWNSLKNTAIDLGNTIMGMLAPYIDIVAEKIGQLNQWFTSLDETQKQHIIQIGLVIAAIGPLLMIIGNVISAVGTISTIIGALASPVGIAVLAIGAITAAFIYLWNTSDEFQQAVKDGFQILWEMVQSFWDNIGKPIFDSIMSMVEYTKEWFVENFGSIEEIVQAVFADISEIWEQHLKPCFEAIGNVLRKYVLPAFEFVFKNTILPIVGNVFNGIKSLWDNTLKPVFTGIIDFITGVFSGDWEKAWNGIVEVFKGIFNMIPTIAETVINQAIALINGIIGGINALTDKVGIPAIPEIPTVSLPRLEKGGVLEKGQIGLLEGNGAEAVVPLENNRKWISRVADDMQGQGIGDNETKTLLREIANALKELNENLPDVMVDAIANGLVFNVNNREFARLVKVVN